MTIYIYISISISIVHLHLYLYPSIYLSIHPSINANWNPTPIVYDNRRNS